MLRLNLIPTLAMLVACLGSSSAVQADWFVNFDESDFVVDDVFNDLRTFDIEIHFEGAPTAGVYSNPDLVGVDYSVFGVLPESTPSGFGAFQLNRPETPGFSLSGAEFYGQGSSINFEIAAGVDLSDGIQFSELTGGTDPIFTFNAREVGTGRYHPPIITLNSDGSGLMENSNNMGGINPITNMEVDVDFGEEYSSNLTFTPGTFTIGSVPEPSSMMVLLIGVGGLAFRRRR